jgi:hypothetical protein
LHTGEHGKREMASGDVVEEKTTPDFGAQQQVLIKPVRGVSELQAEALAATPPKEAGTFRKPDLVELAPLDASIHLDIRYAPSTA